MNDKKERNPHGVFEKPPGSGIWWIRYCDQNGKLHREKVGRKSWAITAYADRKSAIRRGIFQPEVIRKRRVTYAELADDAIRSVGDEEAYLLKLVKEWFPDHDAEKITPAMISAKLDELMADGYAPTTRNRYRSAVMKVFAPQ